ncbi:hypothetical protein [Rhodococcus sp. IEGM 1343]|uniref:hypothetical protein n=1 Tax=Rhodococcus sp. IEGM 1343 TaxID=3082224 RepID=UPI002954060A|nr:hypothetical protein [Rhodococcus sp. IEGM 1343]MDV8055957.1 hypothetical protein [Rhodococcus sp. IEGM 1343]
MVFSQGGPGVGAVAVVHSVALAADPILYCTANSEADSPTGGAAFQCAADDTSQAEGYWDGIPSPDYENTNVVAAQTGSFGRLTLSGSLGLVDSGAGSFVDAVGADRSTVEIRARDDSTVRAASTGVSNLDANVETNSNVSAVATQWSYGQLQAVDGSTIDSYATDFSTTRFDVGGESSVTAYIIDHSSAFSRAFNGSAVELAAGGYSTIESDVDGSTLSALAIDGSTILTRLEGGSVAAIKADSGALTSTEFIDGTGYIRAATRAEVVAQAMTGGYVYVDAYEGSETIASAESGAHTEATSAEGAIVHAVAGGTGGVKAAGVYDAKVEVSSYNSTVEALSVGGYSWSQAFDNSAIFTRSFGYGAEAYSEAFEGALVLTQADSGADPGASARVLGSATGNVYVNAEANGDGARTGVVAVPVIPGSAVGQQALVHGLAYDGAEVSVGARYVAGDVIVAAASGEGSRAFIVVDHSTGTGPVTITVLATEGGTAYIFEDTNEFGCFGGVTSVKTSTGGCESNGNVTVITYADGSTATFTDLVAPANLAAPVDISNPFPTIERLVPDLDVFPRSAAPGARAASTVVSPASDSVHEALGQEPGIGEELIQDHSAASDADVPVAVVTSESDEPATIYDGAAVPTAPVVTEKEGNESPDQGIDSEVADEVTTESSIGTDSSVATNDEAGDENDGGPK